MDRHLKILLDAAAQPFSASGKYAWHFARGKLRHDPVFFSLLRCGILPDAGRLLDLGCGQGILLALLSAAKQQYRSGLWPRAWPPVHETLELHGIELCPNRVQVARRALGSSAHIECRDIRDGGFPKSSVIAMIDVLFYLRQAEQERVLQKAVAALAPNGVLLLREADASPSLRFYITQLGERLAGAHRGRLWQRLHYRAAAEWHACLEQLGLNVHTEPMSQGTPYSNVLFVGHMRGAPVAP